MTTVIHHVGLRVTDLDRAGAFYVDALGGRWLSHPVLVTGQAAERAAGIPDAAVRIALVGYGDAMVELFEYQPGGTPVWASAPPRGRLPHLCLQVEDTVAALERVEAAGGRRVWDDVGRFGRTRAMYVQDPFDNVLELLDGPPSAIVEGFHRAYPESRP